jgi:anti-anti-sigma factor
MPRGSVVDVFGYPGNPPRRENGANSRLIARGRVGQGLVQLDADGGTAIRAQPGFSGSPVVMADDAGDAVTGMVVMASRDGGDGDAYALPVTALAEGWPGVLGSLTVPPSPYKGLSPFDAADAERHLYVGREEDVAELRRLLARRGLVIVAGSSGAGKSSLLAAGLGHSVMSDGWAVAAVRPGGAPLEALARALVEVDRPGAPVGPDAVDDLLGRLRTEGLASVGAGLTAAAGRPLLVCVDPLEDVLDTGCAEEARAEFLRLIFLLRPAPGLGFRVACALRADFIGQLLDQRDTPRDLKQMLHMLAPLKREQVERIIEQPALARGVHYEPGLVSQIADDADGGPSLPLLEWALFEMWRHLQGRLITLADYRRVGGVNGALARHAEAAYERVTGRLGFDSGQIQKLLLSLVRTGAATTRRAVPYAGLSPAQLAVASVLINERLIACRTDDLHGEVLEIAHEALLTRWESLAGWIAEDHRFLDWLTKARDNVGRLLWDSEVAEGREWLAKRGDDIDASVREMIELSHTNHEEQVHQLEDALGKAEDAARLSEALRLASLSEHVGEARGTSSSAAIALAVESLLKAPTVQGDIAIRKSLARAAETVTLINGDNEINEVTYSGDGTLIAAARADGHLSVFAGNGEAMWERGDVAPANSVSFSPNGKWVACGYDNGTALVLSTNHGEQRCRLRHEDAVEIVEFSPDGSVVATACDNGTARLYDAVTGDRLHQFTHAGLVNAIAFIAGGDILATACDDGSARLYDVASGEQRQSIAHSGPVTSVALSRDDALLVTGCDDGHARVYETATGKRRRSFRHRDPVKAVALSHDGSFLAIAGGRPQAGVMRVVDVHDGRELAVHKDKGLLTAAAFSHDDSLVATAGLSGQARLFNLPDGSDYSTISHDGAVTSLSFSPGRIRVVTAGADGKALVSGRVTGDERLLVTHNRRVTSVAFSPDERLLVSADGDGRVLISDWTVGVLVREVPRMATVNSVSISSDGNTLAAGDSHGRAGIYGLPDGIHRVDVLHDGPVRTVAFSPDSNWLGTGSSDSTARIIQVAKPGVGITLSHPGPVNAVGFSRNSQLMATACGGPGSDGLAQVFKIATGARLWAVPHEGWVNWVTFSPDGGLVATASDDGTARVFNAETGEERRRIGHVRRVSHVTFSPDGRWVATASDDRTTRVFSPETGEQRHLIDHDSWVNWVTFSPDGKWLATAGNDGTARIFDAFTGIERNQLAYQEEVNMVAFSPDSQWVATASDDRTARVSPISMEVLLDTARDRMTRPLSPEESRRFGLADPAESRRWATELPLDGSRPVSARSYRRLTSRELDWYRAADWTIAEVRGEIDVYTAPRLRELLIELVNSGHYHLILDLGGVEFLDSTGLGVLVGGLKRVRAHDGQMALVITQARILKIFRMTGQTKVFDVYQTVEEAKAQTILPFEAGSARFARKRKGASRGATS